MDKLIVDVGKIRGLGNIVPPKSPSDFDLLASTITSSIEVINQENVNVFSLNYLNGSRLIITSGTWTEYAPNMSNFTVNCKLVYHTDNVIYSAPVTCTLPNGTVLNDTTDNDGNVSFTIPITPEISVYPLKIKYEGNTNVSSYTTYATIRLGNIQGLELNSDKSIISKSENTILTATLTGTNILGEHIGVKGQIVNFYEEYTPELILTSDKNILQKGETAKLSVQLKDSADGSLVAESGILTKIYQTLTEGLLFNDSTEHSYTSGTTRIFESISGTLTDLTDDWILEFDMKNDVGSGGINIGATQHHQPPSSANYRLFIGTDSTKFNFNNRTLQSNHSNTGTRETGTFYHFKLVKTGANVSAYYDDNLIATKNITWWNDYDSFEIYFINWNGTSVVKNISFRTI
ncbi:hypothetical protein SAMN05216439_1182 [Methanobrevibacter gottschalkii]|uniref:Uncharacterized protein n=1 Tax=Methanobrevibacter gottschalkii TaxID=190974 RepID=A0A1H7I9S7_9EURY|nr:hypothetical protein [Methanobrevibacter gottschalkii]SEK59249.1 hypothetical protein SAMN05216439_1182 [Methanobrevibacter gottschalkii]